MSATTCSREAATATGSETGKEQEEEEEEGEEEQQEHQPGAAAAAPTRSLTRVGKHQNTGN